MMATYARQDRGMTDVRIDRPDGRSLAVHDAGDPAGPVVVLCHPAPGSRLLDPDPGATAAAGVRLVSVDRPGYGGSTPIPDGTVPTIPAFADDVAAALDALGTGPAALVGWSAGGRIALAVASRRPDLARAVAVVATPAPHEAVPWIPDAYLAQLNQLRADPGHGAGVLAEVLAPTADPAAVGVLGAGEADEGALCADPSRRARLEAMLAEAYAQRAIGVAADIVSYTVADWGFDPGAVAVPTTAFYGDADEIVTPAHGEWYIGRVPRARLRTVPGEGHLVAMTRWGEVLAAVA
jgi:pimeloyl-ACP methyl ester carboxylesterase